MSIQNRINSGPKGSFDQSKFDEYFKTEMVPNEYKLMNDWSTIKPGMAVKYIIKPKYDKFTKKDEPTRFRSGGHVVSNKTDEDSGKRFFVIRGFNGQSFSLQADDLVKMYATSKVFTRKSR